MATRTFQPQPVGGINENIIDNAYFVGGGSQLGYGAFPINDRGQTSYAGQVATINRWGGVNAQSSLTISADGITTTSQRQIIRPPRIEDGEMYTLSFFGKSGSTTIFGSVSHALSTSGSSWQLGMTVSGLGWVGIQYTSGYWDVRFNTSSGAVLQAIKLERGNRQTLAHKENGAWVLNEIPNYAEALLRCRVSADVTTDEWANIRPSVVRLTAQFTTNANGYFTMPDEITSGNLISVFSVSKFALNVGAAVLVPYFEMTTAPEGKVCYAFWKSGNNMVPLANSKIDVTFVYQA